jgi:sarcosine oxidase subunit alpha
VPPRRTRKLERPITITLDGKSIEAEAGVSLAAALVGAGQLALARSSKFHRPRGPHCLRGGCDGCLMRVDGVPNVMTCGVPASHGARVERQNVVGVGDVDLMRATDWFFKKGINHHELLTGVPGIQKVMISFARRVSGLGELPDETLAPRASVETRAVDVLVVGAGPAGLGAARSLASRGLSVLVVDEQPEAGGSLLAFARDATAPLGGAAPIAVEPLRRWLVDEARAAGAELMQRAVVWGVLEGFDWLVEIEGKGLLRVNARAHVIAAGAHDASPAFAGNDIPGVLSARAAGRLLRDGVLIGEDVLVAGEGPFASSFAESAAREGARVHAVALAVVEVHGLSAVNGATLRTQLGREQKVDCDAVVVDAPASPSFELAAEAGAEIVHADAGFSPRVTSEGRVVRSGLPRPLFALGEITGAAFAPERFAEEAERIAGAVVAALAGER